MIATLLSDDEIDALLIAQGLLIGSESPEQAQTMRALARSVERAVLGRVTTLLGPKVDTLQWLAAVMGGALQEPTDD